MKLHRKIYNFSLSLYFFIGAVLDILRGTKLGKKEILKFCYFLMGGRSPDQDIYNISIFSKYYFESHLKYIYKDAIIDKQSSIN